MKIHLSAACTLLAAAAFFAVSAGCPNPQANVKPVAEETTNSTPEVKLSADNADARSWLTPGLSLAFFMVAVVFVWRSFYTMRIGAVVAEEGPSDFGQIEDRGEAVGINPQPEPPGIAMSAKSDGLDS